MKKGLGRLNSKDPRDAAFPARMLLQQNLPVKTRRYWNASGWWGDQLLTSKCTSYSALHWVEDGPVTHEGNAPVIDPHELYILIQSFDPWKFPHDGSTIRATAKALQHLGYAGSYYWTNSLQEMIDCLLHVGPLIIGIDWYEGMSEPNEKGIGSRSGAMEGGHAIKVDGVDTKTRLFRLKNSWGREYGRKGFVYLPFDDMEVLIKDQYAEVMIATEVKK